jgi:hypothetical protein
MKKCTDQLLDWLIENRLYSRYILLTMAFILFFAVTVFFTGISMALCKRAVDECFIVWWILYCW